MTKNSVRKPMWWAIASLVLMQGCATCEPSATPGRAALRVDTPERSYIDRGAEHQYWVQLDEAIPLRVSLTWTGEANLDIALKRASGETFGAASNVEGSSESINVYASAGEGFFVAVQGIAVTGFVPYEIEISRDDGMSEPDPDPDPDPEPIPEPPADAISITTSQDAGIVSGAHPEGTAFVFEAGVHRVNVRPKNGQRFYARSGAVLDGGGTLSAAFFSGNFVRGVELYGLEIRNYAPGSYFGVVDAGSQEWADGAEWNAPTNWLLQGLNIHDNGGQPDSSAIHVGSGTRVLGGHLWNNQGQGIVGHGHSIEIRDVEINNNSLGVTGDMLYWHSGGMKLVVVHDSEIVNCNVHDNVGPGVWIDVNSDNIAIRDNEIRDNSLNGVFYEISRGGVITGNTVEGNGFAEERGWFFDGGGIMISTSRDCLIEDNIVRGNAGGIWAIDQRTLRARDFSGLGREGTPLFGRLNNADGSADPWAGSNITFRNNTIGASGQNGASSAGNNESIGSDIHETTTFVGNTYSGANTWLWGTSENYASEVTFAQWQALGFDR